MDFLKKHAYLIVAGILLLHFIVSLFVSTQESAIYDEKAHIPAAYSYVRYGDMRLNPEHPPLIKDLSGLALLPLQPDFPLQSPEWQTGDNEQWAVGDMFINCTNPDMACNDADKILFWSRLPIILLSVVLGIALFLWTKELGGTLAGLFAVTLYAADPNIIAHNHYVTTDLGIAAFIFFAFYFFVRFLKNPSLENVIVAGIFLGLAELTKFSAVMLFPIFGLFVILYALTKQKSKDSTRSAASFRLRAVLEYGWKFSGIIFVCFALIWSLYAWNMAGMPADKVVAHADLFLSQPNAPAKITHDIIVQMSSSPFLLPFAEYFVGIAKVFSRFEAGNIYYFFGTVSAQATAAYFPIVFALKETLVFLFLLVVTALYSLSRIGIFFAKKTESLWDFFAHSFQNKITQYLAVFFILFYSYVSITGNLTIGFRHLFPILPFLYMLVAKTAFDFLRRQQDEPTTHTVLSWILGGITLVVISIPVLAYPGYLSYFNPVTGGNQNGYKYVTDSNYDWGQDLKRLRDFTDIYNNYCITDGDLEGNCRKILGSTPTPSLMPIDKIRVDYFGGGSPTYYLGDKLINWWDKRDPEPGWYAISSFFYQQSIYQNKQPGEQSYEWLKDIAPVARAGDSIFIYYISPEIMDK